MTPEQEAEYTKDDFNDEAPAVWALWPIVAALVFLAILIWG